MGVRTLRQLLVAGIACAALLLPAITDAQGRVRNQDYQRGYNEGVHHGEFDARAGASFDPSHDAVVQRANDSFRHGYFDGYRAGYDGIRVVTAQRGRGRVRENRGLVLREGRFGSVDPYATGYERGYDVGLRDGREGDRYDPVRHRNYRDGDEGYRNEYGSRDAYKTNYRAGFRQGYEEGYRQGSRNRR